MKKILLIAFAGFATTYWFFGIIGPVFLVLSVLLVLLVMKTFDVLAEDECMRNNELAYEHQRLLRIDYEAKKRRT